MANSEKQRPYPLQTERNTTLVKYAQDLLQQKRDGASLAFPSYRQLSQQFGFPFESGSAQVLRKAGLQSEIKSVKPDNSLRARQVREYTEAAIKSFNQGETSSLPTVEDIMIRFDYDSYHSAYTVVKTTGLIDLRTNIGATEKHRADGRRKKEEKKFNLQQLHSRDGAWLLGVIVGGQNDLSTGQIGLTHTNEDLVREFELTGRRVFGVNAHSREIKNKKTVSRKRYFTRANAARSIGDLSRKKWSETIVNRHKWIIDNPIYLWEFLSGLFDARGSIRNLGRHHEIHIRTGSLQGANFLTELLTRVGVNNPTVRQYAARGHQMGINVYVSISNLSDMNVFADSIHSKVKDKTDKMRDLKLLKPKPPYKPKTYSDEQIVTEWERIASDKVLGHIPSVRDISRLARDGGTTMWPTVYIKRFGEGKWVKARETLMKLSSEKDKEVKEIDMQEGVEITLQTN